MQLLSKDLKKYFLLTIGLTWVIWMVPVLKSQGVLSITISSDLFRIMGTYVPSVVGLIFLMRQEKHTFSAIFKKIIYFKFPAKWLFYMFLLIPSLMFASYLIAKFVFQASYELELLANPGIIPIAFFYILITGGPLGEEIGWRGYALKKLLTNSTPFVASIILGLVWSLWHLPLFFIEGTAQQDINLFVYIIYTTLLTIMMTVLYIKTKGSIFAAIIFHTTANLGLGLFPIFTDAKGLISIALVLIGAIVTIMALNKDILFKRALEN